MPYRIFAPQPYATLTVGGPVVPGQPITLSWQCTAPTGFGGKVVATISFNNTPIYTSASLPMKSAHSLGASVQFAGEDQVVVQLTPNQQAAQQGLYMIGTNTLTLSVVGNGPQSTPLTATAPLRVIPEIIVAGGLNRELFGNYFVFNPSIPLYSGGPTFTPNGPIWQFQWNVPFAISGIFTNASRFSQMTAALTLVQTNQQNNETSLIGTVQIATADIGQSIPVAFPSINPNWAWVTCPSGVTTGERVWWFTWSVTLSLQDRWGNGYQPVTTSSDGIVFINDSKWNNASNAHMAWIAAMEALATIICAPAAAALIPLAAEECGCAQDPPTPDFNYHKTAKITALPLSQSLAETKSFPATRGFLGSTLELTAINEALSQTEGKLIAARSNNDAKGIELQTRMYRAFEENLGATARTLRSATAKVLRELEAEPMLSTDSVRSAIRSLQL